MIEISLLGRFAIRSGAALLPDLDWGKAGERLGWLLLHQNRLVAREELASVLWPEGSPERIGKYYKQSNRLNKRMNQEGKNLVPVFGLGLMNWAEFPRFEVSLKTVSGGFVQTAADVVKSRSGHEPILMAAVTKIKISGSFIRHSSTFAKGTGSNTSLGS